MNGYILYGKDYKNEKYLKTKSEILVQKIEKIQPDVIYRIFAVSFNWSKIDKII